MNPALNVAIRIVVALLLIVIPIAITLFGLLVGVFTELPIGEMWRKLYRCERTHRRLADLRLINYE